MIKKTIYLILIIIGAFSLYQTASAQTVYENQLSNSTATVDFTCGDSVCRGEQPYVSISQTIPTGLVFNRIRILQTGVNATNTTRFGASIGNDPQNLLPFCDDAQCVNDVFNANPLTTLVPAPQLSSSVGGGWQNLTMPATATSSGSRPYIYISVDPNPTHQQPRTFARATAGQTYNGFNTNRQAGSYVFQLCFNFCDEYLGQPQELSINTIDFLTKFTGATVQGASTSISFDVDYFLNTPEYTANTRPDLIQVLVGRDGFGQVALARQFILPLSDGNHTKNVPVNYDLPDTKEFIDGDYYAYINFWNLTTDGLAFNKTNVVLTFTIDNGLVINQQVVSLTDGTEISVNIQYQDCSLSNIQGCLINAFIFVFVPAPNAFDKFLNLWERIEYKPPFGYVVGILDALNGLVDNATPAFSFGNIPFLNDIFTPFRALLIIGLWVLYALFFMGRLSKLQL